jgi:hypothetical protein
MFLWPTLTTSPLTAPVQSTLLSREDAQMQQVAWRRAWNSHHQKGDDPPGSTPTYTAGIPLLIFPRLTITTPKNTQLHQADDRYRIKTT